MSVCREKLLDDAQFSQEWSKAPTSFTPTHHFLSAADAAHWNSQGTQSLHEAQRLGGTCECFRRALNRVRGALVSFVEAVQSRGRRLSSSRSTSDESLEHDRCIFVTSSSEGMGACAEAGSGSLSNRTETGDGHGRARSEQHISGLRRRKRIWYDLDTHGSVHSVRADDDLNSYVVDGVGELKGRFSVQFGFKTNVVAIKMGRSSMDFFIMEDNTRSSVIDDLTDSQTPSESSDSTESWDIIEEGAVSGNDCGADAQESVTVNIDGRVLMERDLSDDCREPELVEEDFEIIDSDIEQFTDDEGDIVVLRRNVQ